MDKPADASSTLPLPEAPPPVSRRRRWVGALITLTLLAALGATVWYLTQRPAASTGPGAGFGPGGPGGPGAARARGGLSTTVGDAVARRADIPVLIEALGTVTPLVSVTVRPQVSGVLKEVLFTEGQMVKQGQVLAVIDPQSFQNALNQATGARVRDEAQLENARLTLERYRTLLSQDSIARQDVDTQATLVKQLEGTVAINRATENTARLNLGYTRIVAPVAGRVGLRVVDAGNYVSAGDAAGVAVITQMAPIDVAFSLPQDMVPEVQSRMGQKAALPAKALDRTRTATLDAGQFATLDNQIDTQTGTVKAKARFPNADGKLFPNQFVNLQLQLRTIQNAVVVPVSAVRTGSDGDYVYVVNEDRTVSLRQVRRGVATPDLVAIVDGLRDGERVVTEGADRLRDGARVVLAADRAAAVPAPGASSPARAAASAMRSASGPAAGSGRRVREGEVRGPSSGASGPGDGRRGEWRRAEGGAGGEARPDGARGFGPRASGPGGGEFRRREGGEGRRPATDTSPDSARP